MTGVAAVQVHPRSWVPCQGEAVRHWAAHVRVQAVRLVVRLVVLAGPVPAAAHGHSWMVADHVQQDQAAEALDRVDHCIALGRQVGS